GAGAGRSRRPRRSGPGVASPPPLRHFRDGRQRRPQNDQADRGPPGQEDFLLLDDQDPVSHRPLLYATSATAGSGDRGMIRRIVVPRAGALSFSSSPRSRSRIFSSFAPPPPRPAGVAAEW